MPSQSHARIARAHIFPLKLWPVSEKMVGLKLLGIIRLAPKAFDAMTKLVLAYRPKPKSAPARKRQRKRRKNEKAARD